MNICQRIVSQVGRRVDEASPICDARLLDGSRVNVIAPPLAIDGAALTIRKFKKDKLTLDQLVRFGSISPAGAEILKIIGRVRCNVIISGGTGSGKTTLLNCLTNYIEADERVITCEDAAELQLQQPHVVRLETRPPNLEGRRSGDDARPGQELPAYAPRADHRRRGARTGGVRPAAGDEHRPRRLDGHAARQLAARGAEPHRIDDHHGRLLAAVAHHPRDDRLVGRRHHPGGAPARRLAPHHPHHRGDGHGRRRHHHPGPVRLRNPRRGRAGQAQRPAPLDRHRPAALLGSRALLRRGAAAGGGARRVGNPRRSRSRFEARLGAMVNNMVLAAGLAIFALGGLAFVFAGGNSRADQRRASVAEAGRARPARRRRRSRRQQEADLRKPQGPREEVAAQGRPTSPPASSRPACRSTSGSS